MVRAAARAKIMKTKEEKFNELLELHGTISEAKGVASGLPDTGDLCELLDDARDLTEKLCKEQPEAQEGGAQ